MFLSRAAIFLICAIVAAPVQSHEFWISPETYFFDGTDALRVHLRVGTDFEGASYSYNPGSFARFDAGPPEALAPVKGRLGDRPALALRDLPPGLLLIVHETTDLRLTYRAPEKFPGFVANHDLGDWVLPRHAERGLPETGFREAYRRFAKSLVAVGPSASAGGDRRVGLAVEIVAETNPYALHRQDTVRVRLWRDDAPHANAQLEVFARAPSGEVTRTNLRSDADGHVDVPVHPGDEVLLNFVVLRELEGDVAANTPVWRSLWASLTFAVPATQ